MVRENCKAPRYSASAFNPSSKDDVEIGVKDGDCMIYEEQVAIGTADIPNTKQRVLEVGNDMKVMREVGN